MPPAPSVSGGKHLSGRWADAESQGASAPREERGWRLLARHGRGARPPPVALTGCACRDTGRALCAPQQPAEGVHAHSPLPPCR